MRYSLSLSASPSCIFLLISVFAWPYPELSSPPFLFLPWPWFHSESSSFLLQSAGSKKVLFIPSLSSYVVSRDEEIRRDLRFFCCLETLVRSWTFQGGRSSVSNFHAWEPLYLQLPGHFPYLSFSYSDIAKELSSVTKKLSGFVITPNIKCHPSYFCDPVSHLWILTYSWL